MGHPPGRAGRHPRPGPAGLHPLEGERGDGVPAAGRVPSPWRGVPRGCRAVLDHPGCAMLPLPCHATPCCWATATPCHAVPWCQGTAVPCCAMLCYTVPSSAVVSGAMVPCHVVPCPASPSHFLPSAASSSGAAKPPATPLIITGPAGGYSPPRRTSRLWRVSGNAGPAPRAGSSQHGCARAHSPPCTGVRRSAVCPGGGMRACGVCMQLCEGLKQWGGQKEGLQCQGRRERGFAVLVRGCARVCSAAA